MRGLSTLSAVGTTNLALGDAEFIAAGQRVFVKGADSVATATLRVVFAGVEVFTGPLAIEDGTDFAQPWTKLLTCFQAKQNGQLSVILGGTVAGARVDLLILNSDEPLPF
jgi:hypothetical protein